MNIFISAKEMMFSDAFVCLSVCFSVFFVACIFTFSFMWVGPDQRMKRLYFGKGLDHPLAPKAPNVLTVQRQTSNRMLQPLMYR